jgi:hypothetical protein
VALRAPKEAPGIAAELVRARAEIARLTAVVDAARAFRWSDDEEAHWRALKAAVDAFDAGGDCGG